MHVYVIYMYIYIYIYIYIHTHNLNATSCSRTTYVTHNWEPVQHCLTCCGQLFPWHLSATMPPFGHGKGVLVSVGAVSQRASCTVPWHSAQPPWPTRPPPSHSRSSSSTSGNAPTSFTSSGSAAPSRCSPSASSSLACASSTEECDVWAHVNVVPHVGLMH